MRYATYATYRTTPAGPCMCGACDCPSCGPAQGYDIYAGRIDELAEEVVEEWLADRQHFQDYPAGFSEATWVALEEAAARDDAAQMLRVFKDALREQMQDDAREEARERIHAEIAEARMGDY